MRTKFHQEEFPSAEQIEKACRGSAHEREINIAICYMWNTWKTIAHTFGFELVRFSFQELTIIIHKMPMNIWAIEFTNYEKTNSNKKRVQDTH